MDFYVLRVLFPAILIDIPLTASFLRKRIPLKKDKRGLGAFIATPLYLIGSLFWIVILGAGDPRFQGQGVLGLYVILVLGIVFTILRLLLGFILFISLRHR